MEVHSSAGMRLSSTDSTVTSGNSTRCKEFFQCKDLGNCVLQVHALLEQLSV